MHQVVSVDESGQGIRLFDKPGKSAIYLASP